MSASVKPFTADLVPGRVRNARPSAAQKPFTLLMLSQDAVAAGDQ
jgi:hypothetical protein